MAEALLELEGVHAGYGETVVLEDLSIRLGEGESISVVGRNGVGKSSLLATVMGLTTLHRGRILFAGDDVARRPTHLRSSAGLGFVPQEREVFPSLTVRENLEVAARDGPWTLPRVFDLFPHLAQRSRNRGNQLSGGEQQMLSIGRALMGNPRVLLMDEPSEGLAPVIVEQLEHATAKLRDEAGIAIVLVEQHIRLALSFSPRCLVINRGRIVFDGASDDLRDEGALRDYMGLAS
ncbi:MAG: ABC transporter ATP-binding protein [Alphaproteobacteria bacterium]|jgi:branched-chain amino acid transport system ATP-binding protein|nr:ABC transporter ATP-binding protein [Alphaproteobacteria bacterium]